MCKNKHLLNDVIDITTNKNNEEVRTPLKDILIDKASINHFHDTSDKTKA